ncbi:hypothetical protein [Pseudomonas fluorescens]|jgi:hypothetical protein|uniref:hypothetical protein n=1 Tax=Pseudomonas fluorescens TaxID=294 RepID=UPI000FB6FF06|nr:hypothetical protein [Pseudomonas fluorescens]CAG8867739.1 hypothetical protein PS861_02159 [Pseudomonas fluorescens]
MTIFVPDPLPPEISVLPRKPLTSGQPHRRVTHFPSMKNTDLIACESRLHARFCLHLEFEPRVITYASRPFALHFADAAVTARPDFAAVLADGRRVYYQVGIAHEIVDPRQQDRLSLIRACFGRAGLIFEQVSPDQYQSVARTETLCGLYHHAQGASSTQASRIRQVLRDELNGRATIRHLVASGIRVNDIAFALFFQHIHTDLHKPIDLNSLVVAY